MLDQSSTKFAKLIGQFALLCGQLPRLLACGLFCLFWPSLEPLAFAFGYTLPDVGDLKPCALGFPGGHAGGDVLGRLLAALEDAAGAIRKFLAFGFAHVRRKLCQCGLTTTANALTDVRRGEPWAFGTAAVDAVRNVLGGLFQRRHEGSFVPVSA